MGNRSEISSIPRVEETLYWKYYYRLVRRIPRSYLTGAREWPGRRDCRHQSFAGSYNIISRGPRRVRKRTAAAPAQPTDGGPSAARPPARPSVSRSPLTHSIRPVSPVSSLNADGGVRPRIVVITKIIGFIIIFLFFFPSPRPYLLLLLYYYYYYCHDDGRTPVAGAPARPTISRPPPPRP